MTSSEQCNSCVHKDKNPVEEPCNECFLERIEEGMCKYENNGLIYESCPDCGYRLVQASGCPYCPDCGWSRCK